MEYGSQKILDRIKKDITIEQIIEVLKKLKKHNIEGSATFMTGFPFETEEDLNELLNFFDKMHKINPRFKIFLCIYAPGPETELYKECIKKFGLKKINSLDEWSTFDWGYQYLQIPWIPSKKRDKLQTIAFIVQFRFGRIEENLKKIHQKLAFKFLKLLANLRWKYRFFSFPIEWRLYAYLRTRWRMTV